MSKRQLQKGICRLCAENTMLNFEHVPPRSTFNKNTRYVSTPYIEYMQNDKPFDRKIKGKVGQGGIGFYSFCESCNNFLGTAYVRSYKNWVDAGAYILTKGDFQGYNYIAHKQKPNQTLKQIISMFIAINGEWFVEEYPELVEFVNDTHSTSLNEKYNFYTYLNDFGAKLRYLPFMITGNLSNSEIIKCCEISFAPFGYVMTIDSKPKNKHLLEITHFKNYDPDKEVSLEIQIAKLHTHVAIPLDYRSKKEIEEAIHKSNISEL